MDINYEARLKAKEKLERNGRSPRRPQVDNEFSEFAKDLTDVKARQAILRAEAETGVRIGTPGCGETVQLLNQYLAEADDEIKEIIDGVKIEKQTILYETTGIVSKRVKPIGLDEKEANLVVKEWRL